MKLYPYSLQGIVAFKRFILQSEEQFGEINSKENFVLEFSNSQEQQVCEKRKIGMLILLQLLFPDIATKFYQLSTTGWKENY